MTERADQKALVFGTGMFLRAFLCDFADRAGVPVTLVSSTPAGDERVAQLNRRAAPSAPLAFTLAYRGLGEDGQVTDTWRTVGSIRRALPASSAWAEVLETAHDPAITTVASNVSESGMRLSDESEADRPGMSPPASFPAKLARWLWERYQHFNGDEQAGVVVLPCELIENNGRLLRGMVDELAARWGYESGFLNWLDAACPFPDTLVDRIALSVPDDPAEHALWRERLGGEAGDDPLLTICEPFALWAIRGDDALAARIGWLVRGGEGSVVVAPDITPFVLRKVRILNGLHSAMASIAPGKYGLTHVRECLEHPELGPFLRALVFDEIVPAIAPPLDSDDARAYAETTWRRMSNPFLVHPLAKINQGADAKWQARLLPTMRAYEERFGQPPPRLTACREAFFASR